MKLTEADGAVGGGQCNGDNIADGWRGDTVRRGEDLREVLTVPGKVAQP